MTFSEKQLYQSNFLQILWMELWWYDKKDIFWDNFYHLYMTIIRAWTINLLFIPYFCLLVFGILVNLVAWFSFHFLLPCPYCVAKFKQRFLIIYVFLLRKPHLKHLIPFNHVFWPRANKMDLLHLQTIKLHIFIPFKIAILSCILLCHINAQWRMKYSRSTL